jgi:Uma2 family endonuclease
MSSATHILTLEEALALPVDRLEEIVNGEIRQMPPPEKGHFRLITVLARLLSKQLPEERFDVITTAYGLGIRREPAVAVRIPDITVFDSELLRAEYEETSGKGYVWIAPKLVTECLSPSNRKGSVYQLLADYESASAAEVWLIDPKRRIVTPYVLEEGQLVQRNGIDEGSLVSVALPVQIDVSRLWQAFETGR